MSKIILNIDLDIIMKDYIPLYESFLRDTLERWPAWSRIEEMLDLNRHLSFDFDLYHLIGKVVSLACDNVSQVYVGSYNSSIMTSILQEEKKGNLEPPYTIININHHHDLSNNRKFISDCTEDNWITHLYLQDKLEQSIWVKDDNSDGINLSTIPAVLRSKIQFIDISSINELLPLIQQADILFIVSNFLYFPPQFDKYLINILRIPCKKHWDKVVFYGESHNNYMRFLK